MKVATPNMISHLQGEVTTLCTCWEIERTDGKKFYFTDHDQDLTFEGNVYESESGYRRTAVQGATDLGVPNMDLQGVLSSDHIDEHELRAGKFDYAKVKVYVVNWSDPDAFGRIRLRKGWFGEVNLLDNGEFQCELRGLTQAMSHNVIESFSLTCRADFGDTRCKKDVTPLLKEGTVTAVIDRSTMQFASADVPVPANGTHVGGLLSFTTGDNIGRNMEIIGSVVDGSTTTVSFFLPMGYDMEVGDEFKFIPGCDKSTTMCKAWANILNFRGEPFIPGNDSMMDYPDAKD